MAIEYELACMDCGEWFHIGKRYRQVHEPKDANSVGGWPEQWKYNAFNLVQGPQEDKLAFFNHFLMRHTNHELRVFAETNIPADAPGINDITSPHAWGPDPLSEYFSFPARVVNPDAELKEMVPDVIERLEELKRGEKLHDPMKPYSENPRYRK
jgi:hypothetical protein